MKTAKDLMLAYLAGTAEESGALFAENGTLELPYLGSIALPPVQTGPTEITKFLRFLHGSLYPGFSFEEVKIHIHTPEQVFAEYQINHRSGISGKDVRQQFFGHLQADSGKIARLREAIDVVVAAEAIYPNGLADVLAKRSQAGRRRGVGEPGTSAIVPAVTNAICAATGERLRKLPVDAAQLKSA